MARFARLAAAFAAAVLAAGSAPPALACGFHGSPAARMDVAYPGSLAVAVAVAKAKSDGLLPAFDPSRNPLGYLIASKRMKALAAALARASGAEAGAFSLVLVGPRLWSRFDAPDGAPQVRVHVNGPQPGRPVVLTAFIVVDALLRGEMSFEAALEAGLVRIAEDETGAVSAGLAAALGGSTPGAAQTAG